MIRNPRGIDAAFHQPQLLAQRWEVRWQLNAWSDFADPGYCQMTAQSVISISSEETRDVVPLSH